MITQQLNIASHPIAPWRATSEEQAAYIIQKAATAFYHEVELYTHFMLHDDCGNAAPDAFGLRQNFENHVCNPAQGHYRSAYQAYQVAAQEFRQLMPLERRKNEQYDHLVFKRPDDQQKVHILWSRQDSVQNASISTRSNQAELVWVETPP